VKYKWLILRFTHPKKKENKRTKRKEKLSTCLRTLKSCPIWLTLLGTLNKSSRTIQKMSKSFWNGSIHILKPNYAHKQNNSKNNMNLSDLHPRGFRQKHHNFPTFKILPKSHSKIFNNLLSNNLLESQSKLTLKPINTIILSRKGNLWSDIQSFWNRKYKNCRSNFTNKPVFNTV
jgi:hypothetical protein